MKLLWCASCHDVVNLVIEEWRQCRCKAIGGQYNEDGITATIGGREPRVFGIANPFFYIQFPGYPTGSDTWTPEQLEEIHKKYGYGPNEIWWGGYEGDSQLLRIRSPFGPRLSHRAAMKRVARMQAAKSPEEQAKFGNLFTPKILSQNRNRIRKLSRFSFSLCGTKDKFKENHEKL